MATNFNDTTPAAVSGGQNVKWQTDGSGNVSAYTSGAVNGGVSAKTADYNILAADAGKTLVLTGASAHTFTLPASPSASFWVNIENNSTAVLTIGRNSLTIDGLSADLLLNNQYTGITVISDGTNYFTVRGMYRTGTTTVKTGDYSVTAGDSGSLIQMNSSSAHTITLLGTAPSSFWWIIVKNINTGVLTVSRNSLTIDGASSDLHLSQGDSVAIFSDGSNYNTGLPRPQSIAVFAPGVGTNSQVLLYIKLDRATTFPASAPNAYGVANTAATASTTFTFKKNGSSFATANFAISATTATWTQASDAVFAPGDILEIDGPATADATLANIGLTLQGYRF